MTSKITEAIGSAAAIVVFIIGVVMFSYAAWFLVWVGSKVVVLLATTPPPGFGP